MSKWNPLACGPSSSKSAARLDTRDAEPQEEPVYMTPDELAEKEKAAQAVPSDLLGAVSPGAPVMRLTPPACPPSEFLTDPEPLTMFGLEAQGITPCVYRADTLEGDERLALLRDMNQDASWRTAFEPTSDEAPRFYTACPWAVAKPPTNKDVKRGMFEFRLPAMATAPTDDAVVQHMRLEHALDPISNEKATLYLALEPAAVRAQLAPQLGSEAFETSVFHGTILSASIQSARSTIDSDFRVRLETPNMGAGEKAYVALSEPLGVCSPNEEQLARDDPHKGQLFATVRGKSEGKPALSSLFRMRDNDAHRFCQADTARWMHADLEALRAQAKTRVYAATGETTVKEPKSDDEALEPKDVVDFIFFAYGPMLRQACTHLHMQRLRDGGAPVKQVGRIKWGTPVGDAEQEYAYSFSSEALDIVLEHLCTTAHAAQFGAVNMGLMRLALTPPHGMSGLVQLAQSAARAREQNRVATAHLDVLIEMVWVNNAHSAQLAGTGSQRMAGAHRMFATRKAAVRNASQATLASYAKRPTKY
ncbi:MAG: hypothetical protein Q7V62_15350 [Actinomycetota bacterium]|nr:hypothetical protein [Actinomycetota bacterium]